MPQANLQNLEAAIQALEAEIDTAADLNACAAAWAEKGRLLQRLERNTSALAAYDRALELMPGLESAWMRKALLLDELDRTDEALAAYAGLLTHHPRHVAGWSNRAGLMLREGRFDDALECLNCAIESDPEGEANALLCLNKGLLLLQAFDRPGEALPWIERAIPTGFPEAAEALALCQEALNG